MTFNEAINTIKSSMDREVKEKILIPTVLIFMAKQNLRLDKKEFNRLYNKRTPDEILQSGFVTGCTDEAILFSALIRGLGFKDTFFVETLSRRWVESPAEEGGPIYGHTFVFVGDYLVDPSKKVVFIDGRTIERDWVVLGKKIELTEFGFHNAEILKKECRLFKANYKRQN